MAVPPSPRMLYLLRHAKSDWDSPAQDDFERPLNARGRDAAGRVGAYMASRGFLPTHVLCSSAARTRETWALLSEALGIEPVVETLDDLYLASPGRLLARIEGAPSEAEGLLVIAHNPGLGDLAHALAEGGAAHLVAEMRRKFPTAALATYEVDAPDWRDPRPRLVDFVRPRDLPSRGRVSS